MIEKLNESGGAFLHKLSFKYLLKEVRSNFKEMSIETRRSVRHDIASDIDRKKQTNIQSNAHSQIIYRAQPNFVQSEQ